MTTTLSRERDGRVARVRYDNARRGNSFDDTALAEFTGVLESAAADPACVVIRLDMAGKHFCGGWDTTSFGDLSASTTEEVAAALRASDDLLDRIRRLPVPIVGAVRGKVIGFGAGLLAALHFPVVAADARLTLPEVAYGFAPAGVGHVMAQTLPRPLAYALLSGVAGLTGSQLHGFGLAVHAVADDEVDAVADQLVESLAATPGNVMRAVVEVVESSRATGRPDQAFLASAATIVAAVGGAS